MLRATGTLKPGDMAPPFALPTQRGELQTLSEFLARGRVLLAFHRGTW